jgi:hypothetical protein
LIHLRCKKYKVLGTSLDTPIPQYPVPSKSTRLLVYSSTRLLVYSSTRLLVYSSTTVQVQHEVVQMLEMQMLQDKQEKSPDLEPLVLALDVDIAPLPEISTKKSSDLDFAGLLTKPLRVYQDLTSGCGGQTWPAGMLLAKHMLRYHRHDLCEAKM